MKMKKHAASRHKRRMPHPPKTKPRRSHRMRTPKTPEEMDRMSADLLGDEPL